MKGLSAIANDTLLAQATAVAMPYNALAASLAAHNVATGAASEKVAEEKVSTWNLFKSAIKIASDNSHSPQVMRAGLEIACIQAGIPAGSFRGYVSTVENLAGEVQAGTMTLPQVADISVKDARKRYAPAPTAEQVERARLAKATDGWTAEQLSALATIAESMNPAADAAPVEGEELPENRQRNAA